MSDDGGSCLFVSVGGGRGVVEKLGLSVRHQTPVLHRPKVEVRQSDLICQCREKVSSDTTVNVLNYFL